MKQPKYNIGDTVWIISNRKAKKTKIFGNAMLRNKRIIYPFHLPFEDSTSYFTWLDEKSLFSSKEDLLKSL